MTTNTNEILSARDAKAKPHLAQYAPVWLIDEKVIADEDAVVFNVMFEHNLYGWVNRRYRYDSFNDVLYYRGQTPMPEARTLEIQEQEPYLAAFVADIPNAYGG
jgi:hypothetical protein